MSLFIPQTKQFLFLPPSFKIYLKLYNTYVYTLQKQFLFIHLDEIAGMQMQFAIYT